MGRRDHSQIESVETGGEGDTGVATFGTVGTGKARNRTAGTLAPFRVTLQAGLFPALPCTPSLAVPTSPGFEVTVSVPPWSCFSAACLGWVATLGALGTQGRRCCPTFS